MFKLGNGRGDTFQRKWTIKIIIMFSLAQNNKFKYSILNRSKRLKSVSDGWEKVIDSLCMADSPRKKMCILTEEKSKVSYLFLV